MFGGPILRGKQLQPLADAVGAVQRGERAVLCYGNHADAAWIVGMIGFGHARELHRRAASLDLARWVFDHASGGRLVVRLARAR
jgi:hypothetical protein